MLTNFETYAPGVESDEIFLLGSSINVAEQQFTGHFLKP